MATVKVWRYIGGHWYLATICPPRQAKGSKAGKPSTVANSHHFRQVAYNPAQPGTLAQPGK